MNRHTTRKLESVCSSSGEELARVKQCVILVGGKGTRLGQLTRNTPKPLMPIGDMTFLDVLLDELARYGMEEMVLLCGFHAEQIMEKYEGRTCRGVTIRCVAEKELGGTGGALRDARDALESRFLLCNGDSFFDINFLDLAALPKADDWLAAIALRRLDNTGRFGRVELEGKRITRFAEKIGTGPGLINGGVYLMRREIVDYIPEPPCSLEADVFPTLAQEGLLYGSEYQGYFIDIGIPEDLRRAQQELAVKRRQAILFECDGVLTRSITSEVVEWMPGAVEAIKQCNDQSRLVLAVIAMDEVEKVISPSEACLIRQERVQNELQAYGAHIDGFYWRHRDPSKMTSERSEGSMLSDATVEWALDTELSFWVEGSSSGLVATTMTESTAPSLSGSDVASLVQQILE